MKLGEIKLEALRIMNINHDNNLTLEKMESLREEKKYAKYLNNMLGPINKAIDQINCRNILPKKKEKLSGVLESFGKKYNKFDITKIAGFLKLDDIIYESREEYLVGVPYFREGDSLVISSAYLPENLTIVYYKKAENVTESKGNDDEVKDIPDEIARLIPYYIKFELYQEDEPNLAIASKNIFDTSLELLRHPDEDGRMLYIENVYKLEG